MIFGIGCDLVEIARVARAAKNPRFLAKCFSAEELAAYRMRGDAYLAGNFAAKEAVVKAAGCGFRGFWPREIEILRNEMGAPYVKISQATLLKLGILETHIINISISNEKNMVVAMAIIGK
ncbi:MAG: holo-ACP synthase [Defluviitaleaceae bacterium]|nr:holo-ACP synthase [Defluviitaleaceae bacterium]